MRLTRAAPWVLSVCTPACQPDSEMAGTSSRSSAMAVSAIEASSPVAISASSSRLDGWGLTSSAWAMRWSVVLPWAETTTTTWLPLR